MTLFEACSTFTRVTACMLAKSLKDPLHRRLQPLCYLHDCSDCFRPERQLSGGIRTHWRTAPLHGARAMRAKRRAIDFSDLAGDIGRKLRPAQPRLNLFPFSGPRTRFASINGSGEARQRFQQPNDFATAASKFSREIGFVNRMSSGCGTFSPAIASVA